MVNLADIQKTGRHLLSRNPDAIPRLRILRDLLDIPDDSDDVVKAKEEAKKSKWTEILRNEQHEDGSWGRFHTEDTKRKQKIPTTQFAISRAIELGIDQGDKMLSSAIRYMQEVLSDRRRWPDVYEKNVWFAPGVKIFTAAALSTVDSENPLVARVRDQMIEIYRRTLHSGIYNRSEERSASLDVLGVDVSGSYISISSAPNLELIGSCNGSFPIEMQQTLFKAIWNEQVKTFYLRPRPSRFPDTILSRDFLWWFHTVNVMTRISTPTDIAEKLIEWFQANRGTDGLWDGPRQPGRTAEFPLSESWRRSGNRAIDYSTQIGSLISRLVRMQKLQNP